LRLTDGGVVTIVGAGGKTSLMFAMARELSLAGESVLTTTTTKIFKPDKAQSPQVLIKETLADFFPEAGDLLKKNKHITTAAGVLPVEEGSKLVGFKPEVIDQIKESRLFQWILVEADGAAGRPLKAPDSYEPVIPRSTSKLIGVLGMDGVGKPLTDEWVFRSHRFAEITGLTQGDRVTETACITCMLHEKGIMKGALEGIERFVFLNKADESDGLAKARKIAALLGTRTDTGLQRIIIGQALFEPPVIEFMNL